MRNPETWKFDKDKFQTFSPDPLRRTAGAVKTLIERIDTHPTTPTTAIVAPPRYGKSDFMRLAAIELIETGKVGLVIILEQWKFLKRQINNADKISAMCARHRVNVNVVCDVLEDELDPNFYIDLADRRHWWTATIQWACRPENRLILCAIAKDLKQADRPLIIMIDEGHSVTEQDSEGWGELAAELEMAGAHVALFTGTKNRADNLRPYGFKSEPVESKDIEYWKIEPLPDNPTRRQARKWEAERIKYQIIGDFEIGYDEAWNIDPIALYKIQERWITCRACTKDLKKPISELNLSEARAFLHHATRDAAVIAEAAKIFVDDILRRRRAGIGINFAGMILVGSDLEGDGEEDFHARQVRRIVSDEWFRRTGRQPVIKIATLNLKKEGEDTDKLIIQFAEPEGDILICKNMGTVGFDQWKVKTILDLSTQRSDVAVLQRWLRGATVPPVSIQHGRMTLVIPNDSLTQKKFRTLIEENGGMWITENDQPTDIVVPVKDEPEPQEIRWVDQPSPAGVFDHSFETLTPEQDALVDRWLDYFPELGHQARIHIYRRIKPLIPPPPAPAGSPAPTTDPRSADKTEIKCTVSVLSLGDNVVRERRAIDSFIHQLTNREASYYGSADKEAAAEWVATAKAWSRKAKNYAKIREKLPIAGISHVSKKPRNF